jgi:hypothetical protein
LNGSLQEPVKAARSPLHETMQTPEWLQVQAHRQILGAVARGLRSPGLPDPGRQPESGTTGGARWRARFSLSGRPTGHPAGWNRRQRINTPPAPRGRTSPRGLPRSLLCDASAVLPGRPVGTARQDSRGYTFTSSVRPLSSVSRRICPRGTDDHRSER